uniref:ATP synthase F0 subunit 8 n=1 Tax=Sinosolenaia oleivora TaxID=3237505 RepID=A0A3G1GHK8_9BIVA|nr:ATP synthase F0 subunit 8 [Solenaia oleivora]
MPQFSPMSWPFVALFLVGLSLSVCVGMWWEGPSYYSFIRVSRRSHVPRLFVWGKVVGK